MGKSSQLGKHDFGSLHTMTFGFFAISKSDRVVRFDRYKMQFLKMITIYILQVRVISDYQHLLKYVYFIKYLTFKVARGRIPPLNLSDLTKNF